MAQPAQSADEVNLRLAEGIDGQSHLVERLAQQHRDVRRLSAAALHHHHGVTAWAIAAAGIGAVTGHCFPIWLRLRGGKGVATALGVMLVAAPLATAGAAALFGVLYAATRVVSIGSMAACLALPLLCWLLGRPDVVVVMAAAIAAIVLIRHRANLQRLLAGREPRL